MKRNLSSLLLAVFFSFLSILILLGAQPWSDASRHAAVTPLSQARAYRVRLTVTARWLSQAKTSRSAPVSLSLRIPVPLETERQKVLIKDWSPPPEKILYDRDRNRYASFLFPRVREGETRTATVTFLVQTFHAFYAVDPWKSQREEERARGSPHRQRSTPVTPSPLPEPLLTFSRELSSDESTPFFRILKLYRFCAEQIRFSPSVSLRSLEEVLRTREAQCSDLALFFLALCRGAGMNGRYVGGLSLVEGKEEINELHSWAEVLLPDGWVPIDPTLGRLSLAYRLQCFCELRPYYIALWKGSGGGIRCEISGKGNEETSSPPPAADVDLRVTAKYRRISPWEPVRSQESLLLPPLKLPLSGNQQGSPERQLQKSLSRQEKETITEIFKRGMEPDLLRSAGHQPEWIKPSPPEVRDFVGSLFMESKQFPAAVRAFSHLLEANPAFPSPYHNLAKLYAAYEKWEEVARVAKASERFFQDEFLKGQEGLAYFQTGKFQKAVVAFQEAVRQAPDVGWNHCMLGMAYAKAGRREEAIKSLEEGLNKGTEILDPAPFREALRQLTGKK